MPSGQGVSSSVQSIRNTLSGVLVDESFGAPTSENKKCIAIAQKLITVFSTSDFSAKEMSRFMYFKKLLIRPKKEMGY